MSVTVRLPSKAFDELDRLARDARCSMPELMRRLLRKAGAFEVKQP